jgi:hypothetical protein
MALHHTATGFVLAGALAFALPAIAAPKATTLADMKAHKLADQKTFEDHIRNHITYPASSAEIHAACAKEKDVNAADKKWFDQALPDRTYASADDVLKAVGLQQ